MHSGYLDPIEDEIEALDLEQTLLCRQQSGQRIQLHMCRHLQKNMDGEFMKFSSGRLGYS